MRGFAVMPAEWRLVGYLANRCGLCRRAGLALLSAFRRNVFLCLENRRWIVLVNEFQPIDALSQSQGYALFDAMSRRGRSVDALYPRGAVFHFRKKYRSHVRHRGVSVQLV